MSKLHLFYSTFSIFTFYSYLSFLIALTICSELINMAFFTQPWFKLYNKAISGTIKLQRLTIEFSPIFRYEISNTYITICMVSKHFYYICTF